MQGIRLLGYPACRGEFVLRTIFLEDNFKRKFYTKLLLLGYEFFGRPGLFTRFFHNQISHEHTP